MREHTLYRHRPCTCADCTLGENSKRMLRVLQLTAEGLSGQQVASVLLVSLATVKRDKTRLFDYLGAATSAQAVAIGIREGLIQDEAEAV